MARGTNAKNEVVKKLEAAFGEAYIGCVGGKYYVWANDGGETVQIAISLTCPKTQVEADKVPTSMQPHDWTTPMTEKVETEVKEKVEITEEEKNNIIDLMAALGL